MAKTGVLLGPDGSPINSQLAASEARVNRLTEMVSKFKEQLIRGRYDAAQTFPGNVNHWSNSDNLGPHSAANPQVRKTLRSRSRYEVIENNPYLKGTLLTLANDFVGSGPKLQITDKRLSPEKRKLIEIKYHAWARLRKIRKKIWRLKMAKVVDGEGIMRAYRNTDRKSPIQLDFQVLESEQMTSFYSVPNPQIPEVDGVRFDKFENPVAYHILHNHPGDSLLSPFNVDPGGDWVDARFVIHWFRKDRGWQRGIPELTPSLPLCSILRRYTLAILRHAETAADLTAIIETQGSPTTNPYNLNPNDPSQPMPFDTFPMEMGMFMNLPWGYTMKQLEAVPLGVQYDEFVGAILREIMRPILVTFNISSGTSKDSNMASGVMDSDIYKNGQTAERIDCDEEVCDKILELWWNEASLLPEITGDAYLSSDKILAQPPEHRWRWDKIGLDHTDPAKVAQALQILNENKYLTDRDIQETYYNRDYEDWQEEVLLEDEFRQSLPSVKAEQAAKAPTNDPQSSKSPSNNRRRAKATPNPAKSRNSPKRTKIGKP